MLLGKRVPDSRAIAFVFQIFSAAGCLKACPDRIALRHPGIMSAYPCAIHGPTKLIENVHARLYQRGQLALVDSLKMSHGSLTKSRPSLARKLPNRPTVPDADGLWRVLRQCVVMRTPELIAQVLKESSND